MYDTIEIPSDVKMLYNVLKLKEGVNLDDIELAIGEMCSVVRDTYGDKQGGFVGGQVFEYSGFVSPNGSLNSKDSPEKHVAIITYWRSFKDHEKSHADSKFLSIFESLGKFCKSTHEIGYDLKWQGSISTIS